MINKYSGPLLLLVLAIAAAPSRASSDNVELPPGAKLLDDKLVMYLRPVPLIAPNGTLVAYVSRGFVCIANVDTGEVHRLFEVPDSWSHVFATSNTGDQGGDADSLPRSLEKEERERLQSRVTKEIVSMQWAINSDAVVFGVQSEDASRSMSQLHVWRVPLTGDAKELANVEVTFSSGRGMNGDFRIARNERYLVVAAKSSRPLIWDLATNKPRATPYLFMAPSPTSGHWIAVEKDTRQLVALDDDFNGAARYEEYLPNGRYGFDMIWSPDERFILWRQQIGFDWYSNWVGCRYDLQTRDRTTLTGDYWDETLVFTGHRGEFLRIGSAGKQRGYSGLALTANFIQFVPDERPYPRDVWRVDADVDPTNSTKLLNPEFSRFSTIFGVPYSPNFDRFLITIPREEGARGMTLRLIDRNRHFWRLSPTESDGYFSPFRVAGFAQNGTSIIGYDDKRLFVLPLSSLGAPEKAPR